MMLGRSRPLSRDKASAARLYDQAVARSRQTELYANRGAPDSVEGRFELLTVHVILAIARLRDAGSLAEATRQALFDLYVRNLDGALREMGVGDLAVGRRMKGLGQVFYGRAQAYDAAFAGLPDRSALESLVARTILAGREDHSPGALADYLIEERLRLVREPAERLMEGASA